MQKIALLSSTILLSFVAINGFPASATNPNNSGFYAQALVGGNYLQNQYLYDESTGIGGKAKYKLGWNAQLAAGYRITKNWRADVGITYLRNSTNKVTSTNNGELRGGHISAWTYMLNGYYDITTGTAWTPYFGLGLGAATVSTDYHYGSNFEHSDTAFAYQGILGLSYAINQNLSGLLEFRHVGTTRVESKFEGQKVDGYYQNNLLDLGLRYTF